MGQRNLPHFCAALSAPDPWESQPTNHCTYISFLQVLPMQVVVSSPKKRRMSLGREGHKYKTQLEHGQMPFQESTEISSWISLQLLGMGKLSRSLGVWRQKTDLDSCVPGMGSGCGFWERRNYLRSLGPVS